MKQDTRLLELLALTAGILVGVALALALSGCSSQPRYYDYKTPTVHRGETIQHYSNDYTGNGFSY